MKTFTLVIDADAKRVFASQYPSDTISKELLLTWAHEAVYIPSQMKSSLTKDITKWYEPSRSKWGDNIWRDLYLLDDFHFLYSVNLIETDMSDTLFPLEENAKFTFITYFSYHNEVQQFSVSTLEEGLLLWATRLSIVNRQQRKILLKYIQKGKKGPLAVEGMKNVWVVSYKVFRPLLTLHIIKTV